LSATPHDGRTPFDRNDARIRAECIESRQNFIGHLAHAKILRGHARLTAEILQLGNEPVTVRFDVLFELVHAGLLFANRLK
jgi:hypothetical protein